MRLTEASRFPSRLSGNTAAVPLYACNRCGFTSAAFRVEAAEAHRLQYPECDGTIKIIFRSEDRHRRGRGFAGLAAHRAASPPPQAPSAPGREHGFEIREHLDPDGAVRLTLRGDLDLEVAGSLGERVTELGARGRPVRLDLSQLDFIDSSGVQAILVALTDARWNGWELEVAPEVSRTVARAAKTVGIGQVLWPARSG